MREDTAESRAAIVQRLRTYVNYVDILSLALAYACNEEKESESFPSDSKPWHVAVYEICERFRNEVPELQQIFFDTRSGMVPWSDEVDNWRRCLRMSWLITFCLIPLDHDYEMTSRQRQRIVELYEQRLSHYESQIREMAEIFVTHLVKSEQ